jgi:hypothetical protein
MNGGVDEVKKLTRLPNNFFLTTTSHFSPEFRLLPKLSDFERYINTSTMSQQVVRNAAGASGGAGGGERGGQKGGSGGDGQKAKRAFPLTSLLSIPC